MLDRNRPALRLRVRVEYIEMVRVVRVVWSEGRLRGIGCEWRGLPSGKLGEVEEGKRKAICHNMAIEQEPLFNIWFRLADTSRCDKKPDVSQHLRQSHYLEFCCIGVSHRKKETCVLQAPNKDNTQHDLANSRSQLNY